eukprot:GILJ01020563.1.p1 GENE.GILJ01020563.1~~GILJ01020563.1.p1  ORF type:complete len:258 (-),score=34.42 GILJ01020563.1:53-763(-)
MQEVSVFTDLDTQAFVGWDADEQQIVVAIRGSENIQNWIDDFTFDQVPYPPCGGSCMVHQGFFEVYTALAVNMLPAVKAALLRHPGAPLFITGHSLGAAVSTLATLDLEYNTQDRYVTLYNFGEPRIGDANFSQYAVSHLPQKSQYRVTHHMDPVPHVPLMEWNYLHVPHEIFYNNNGNTSYVICNDSAFAEDPNCSDQYGLPLEFEDHVLYLGVHTGCDITPSDLEKRPLRKVYN